MTPERHARVNELFAEAAELEGQQRDSFLTDACGDDIELRREVESLLAYDSPQTIIVRTEGKEPARGNVDASTRRKARWWTRWGTATKYLGPRGHLALGACVAVALFILLGWLVDLSIQSFQKSIRAAALQEILDGKIAGLEMWLDHEGEKVASWARSSELRRLVTELVDLAADPQTTAEMLQRSPLQQAIRAELVRLAGQDVQYQIWDQKFATIADPMGGDVIGQVVTPYGAAALADVFGGSSRMLTYDKDHQITTRASEYYSSRYTGTVTPVHDLQGKIKAALLVIDGDAAASVGTIFRLANLGKTGETYAFNNDGVLLTESRFDEQLREIGIIPSEPDAISARRVALRDPGGDMTAGFRPREPLATRPLTKMAQYATAGIDGVDVDGYRDYRGVEVVGAWRWLERYGIGVATELDKHELEPGLWLFILLAWIAYGLFAACLVTVVYSYYSLHRLRQDISSQRRIDRYTLEEKIGEGGMGQVFRARHALLKRPTAIKLLKPELVDKASISRFEREAQLASQLTHPNTIEVFDFGVTPFGLFYYVMEYIDGPSFAEEVRQRGPIPPDRACRLLQQVCGSLIEAHDAGLIHRDLKPQNIMLCQRGGASDVVKVLDFGLVKELRATESLNVTALGELAGTPLYIAPERMRNPQSANPRTDIYSFGAVAYFLLTGRDVFESQSVADVLYQVMNVEPQRPSELRSDIPVELDQLVIDCLAKQPEDRPHSVTRVLERLKKVRWP